MTLQQLYLLTQLFKCYEIDGDETPSMSSTIPCRHMYFIGDGSIEVEWVGASTEKVGVFTGYPPDPCAFNTNTKEPPLCWDSGLKLSCAVSVS